MLLYHHCRHLAYVSYKEVKPSFKHFHEDSVKENAWLEKQVGFCPIFLAIGKSLEDIHNTGYYNQWYKKRRKSLNQVLFSFEKVEGRFMDYVEWGIAGSMAGREGKVSDYQTRALLKPSWSKSKWFRKAKEDPHSVIFATPSLDLRKADRIWVRNNQTKKKLENMGFDQVHVKKLKSLVGYDR